MEKPTIKISNNLKPEERKPLDIRISDNLKNTLNDYEMYSDEWLKLQTYIQRDSGDKYKINDMYNNIKGKRILKLIRLRDNIQITKEVNDFVNILQNKEGAWSVVL